MTTSDADSSLRWPPDVRFWAQAVAGIPRIEPAEWQRLDPISRWLVTARAGVLVITAIPCLMAGILAMRDQAFDLLLWSICTLGLLMAHATNNIINDLTDFTKGVDRGNYFRARYGVQPLEHGLLSIRQSITYAAITGGVALAAGGYLLWARGGLTLPLLLAGCFFVLFYTWPLKYIGLGEIAVMVVWGPLMIGGAYFITTGDWSKPVAWLSLVYALGATTVIFGKHIDKLEEDRSKKIRTLPVLLGDRRARATAIGMLWLQYLLVVGLVATRQYSLALLVIFFAVPKLILATRVFREPRPLEAPPDFPQKAWPLWFVSFAFVHNRAFGGLFLLGLLADLVLRRAGVFW